MGVMGLQVRRQLHIAISLPIEDPDTFAEMGLKAASGVLLYGPPGHHRGASH